MPLRKKSSFLKQLSLPNIISSFNSYLLFMMSFMSFPVFADSNNAIGENRQLILSCQALDKDPEHSKALPCIFYIRGFLAGSWGVDNVKTTQLKEVNRELNTWTERAYKYRAERRGDRSLPNKPTYFCSPINESESRIIELLTKGTLTKIETIKDLNAQFYKAIKLVCTSDQKKKKSG